MRQANFVNKAAAQRKIDKAHKAEQDDHEKRFEHQDGAGSHHESGYWSNLEKSHESEDNHTKTSYPKDNADKASNGNENKTMEKFHFEIEDNE